MTARSHLLPSLQFSYVDADGNPVSPVQLTFLSLLSAGAQQNFTYLCQNSAAGGLRFQGTWGGELSVNHTAPAAAASLRVSRDDCRVRGSFAWDWGWGRCPLLCAPPHPAPLYLQLRKGQAQTELQLSSSHSRFLPLLDVASPDFGQANQKFGFLLGPVCFSS